MTYVNGVQQQDCNPPTKFSGPDFLTMKLKLLGKSSYEKLVLRRASLDVLQLDKG